jgi:spore maturation protein CgeB
LNVTRTQMREAGYSPSIRLFEAAACGTPIISDSWAGLDSLFTPGEEILIAETSQEVLSMLHELPEARRRSIGRRARERVLQGHTALHRARELLAYMDAAA